MDTIELKEILLKEHKRDMTLTIVNYLLIIVVIVGIIYLMNSFGGIREYLGGFLDMVDVDKNPEGAKIFRLLIPGMMILGVGYFLFNLFKMLKRPKTIETFISKIDEGKTAEHITENIIYKIVIPLLKIKLNLAPVTQAQVQFEKENKLFTLPIPPQYMTELKTLLSGVQSADVNKAWFELYDGNLTTNHEITPIKPIAEFNTFVEKELSQDLEKVDEKRGKFKKSYIVGIVVSLLMLSIIMYLNYALTSGKFKVDEYTIIYGFSIFMFVVIGGSILYQKMTVNKTKKESGHDHQFKTKVFNRIISFINPNFKYIMHGHIGLSEFFEMGFFTPKQYDLNGDDQIIGSHSGVPFQRCDLSVDRTRNFSSEKSNPDIVFFGQVFIAKFNKSFKSDVYLIPKKLDGGFFGSTDSEIHLDYLGKKVELEDPEFMKLFKVYAEDQIEARYILTSSMMERIKKLVKGKKGKFLISFRNNRISIANHSMKNSFEVNVFQSISKGNQVQQFYEELCEQFKMIDDLKLNINIWKS